MDDKGIGPDAFKDLMSAVAPTVTVVTAYAGGEPIGITVTAFNSVSVDPPIVLVCIDKVAASLEAFLTPDGFTVNFLPSSASTASTLFATKDSSGSTLSRGASRQSVRRGLYSMSHSERSSVRRSSDLRWAIIG